LWEIGGVDIQVLGSDGGRKSGKSDELVLHFDCVCDFVWKSDVVIAAVGNDKVNSNNERESWSEVL
jgi:hypothetical protein